MLPTILICALTFGILFLVDKGFTATFRGTEIHKSGLAVRLPRRICTAGILLCVLAVLVVFADFGGEKGKMLVAAAFVAAMGIGLIVYYMTYGVFYDDEGFVYTSFGKHSATYRYRDIRSQKLYTTTGGSVIVELHMENGKAVSLQSTMDGAYPFLDKAFYRWCAQKGLDPSGCSFHDPDNSLWFPQEEV